jgi:hypothetical protein
MHNIVFNLMSNSFLSVGSEELCIGTFRLLRFHRLEIEERRKTGYKKALQDKIRPGRESKPRPSAYKADTLPTSLAG